MAKFYVSASWSGIVEAESEDHVYYSFPDTIHLDFSASGYSTLDYDFAEVERVNKEEA